MKKKSASQSAFFNLRILLGFASAAGVFVLLLASGAFSKTAFQSIGPKQDRSGEQIDAVSPWTVVANYPRVIESVAVTSDGTYAYGMGGSDGGAPTTACYRYDPVANTWTAIAPLPVALFDARAAYAANVNKVYFFGGLDGGTNVVSTTYIYDVATNSWTTGTAMPAARFFPNVAYYSATGKIYVIGGFDSALNEANQTWEYDPVANTWNTSRLNIPVVMGGSATSISGQFIYLAGSFGAGATTLHYRYDITGNTWTAMAPVPVAVYEAAGGAIGGQTYVIGGGNPFAAGDSKIGALGAAVVSSPAAIEAFNTTFIYDIATNTWSNGPTTNLRRAFTGGTAIGNRLLVVAGYNGQTDISTVEMASASGSTCGTGGPVAGCTGFPNCPTAVSRKTHGGAGTFDVPLPLTGTPGIECRRTGGAASDHQIVVTFAAPVLVTGSPQAQVTSGVGTVGSAGVSNGGVVSGSGNTVTIPLTNVGDAQNMIVTLHCVNDGSTASDVVIPIGFLLGDTNGNATVNASDVSQTKSRIGQSVGAANFRSDLNANGSINASDTAITKANIGTALP